MRGINDMRQDVLFTLVITICLTFPMLAFGLHWLFSLKHKSKDDER